MKDPKVSILVPTYNFARYLPETIESILAQEYRDFELLIVDDCSKDNSAEVVRSYLPRDARIQFEVNEKNRGMVQNWNYCMAKARGEYIKFLFGDDTFTDPQSLGKLVSMLDADPSISIAVSARKIIDENSKWVATWDHLGKSGRHNGKSTIVRCLIKDQNLIGEPSAVLFRKKQAMRGFSLDYRQIVDLEMWFHLLEQGDLYYTPELLCAFRQHAQQQTAVNNANRVGQAERLLLLDACSKKAWISRESPEKERLGLVYSLRKLPATAQNKAMKSHFVAGIGKHKQFLFWLGKKLTRPFENLNNSMRKRCVRLRGKPVALKSACCHE